MYNYINIENIETTLSIPGVKRLKKLINYNTVLDININSFRFIQNLDKTILDRFLAVNITWSTFPKEIIQNSYLNIFLIKSSTLNLDMIKEISNFGLLRPYQLYIDFYIDNICIKTIDILKKLLKEISNYNIRVCYTYENIKDRIRFDKKINPLFKNYDNYYSYQNMITNYKRNFLCIPKALKINLETGDIYLDCKDTFLGNLDEHNIDYFLKFTLNCQEKFCSSGDAINKENNYHNFYKVFYEHKKELCELGFNL